MRCLLFLILTIVSCCKPEMVSPSHVTVDLIKNISPTEPKPYSNPTLSFGSSFGNYFQILYRQNRYKEMVKFTSHKSRKEFGDSTLEGFYENNFRFDFDLGKLTSIQKSGDTSFLIYSNAEIFGTKRKVVLKTILENDSVRLVLDSLKNPFQFLRQ